MARTFLEVSVTWEQVTPESAEQGDAEARGFVIGGLDWPAEECTGEPVTVDMTAADVLREIHNRWCYGYGHESETGATFTANEAQHTDFATGAETTYSVHVRGPARLIRALVRAAKP